MSAKRNDFLRSESDAQRITSREARRGRHWILLANVFSTGDILIAVGAAVIVLAGMGVQPQRLLVRRDANA